MIVFYPKEGDMWLDEYDFRPDITLTPKTRTYYKTFYSRSEFIAYLKDKGYDMTVPLVFTDVAYQVQGQHGVQLVTHKSDSIGWIKDTYTS